MMKEGEIWEVQFDGQGHEYQGSRPAVIIQSNEKLEVATVVTIMPLTSKVEKKYNDDIFVAKNSKNMLWRNSIVRVGEIQSFGLQRFIKKIGTMDNEILFEIKQYLKKHFGI